MKKKALFPGSFDPFTKGHEAIVHKALTLFDEVHIGLGINSTKQAYFELDKRLAHIRSLFADQPNVQIGTFSGLTVNYCEEIGAGFILRGLRDVKDFEYEKSIAQVNQQIAGLETVFLLTEPELSAVNSSIIREIHKTGASIEMFVTNPALLV